VSESAFFKRIDFGGRLVKNRFYLNISLLLYYY